MSISALKRRASEARQWLFEACFPLWAQTWDPASGLFAETLGLDYSKTQTPITRIRVQARQVYVFAEAMRLGWDKTAAQERVEAGIATLCTTARRNDGLMGRSLSLSTGKLADDTADLYDTAFALMAFANAAMVLPDPAPALKAAHNVLKALDLHMRDARNGGYSEALPAPDRRLQNPHMHLFEALLCLHQIDPNGGHDKRSADILSLFLHRFTAGEGRLLGEIFKPDWSEPEGDAAMHIEPGHQFEWVWLLHTHARQHAAPLPPEARKLYAFAVSTTDQDGRAMQGITRRGVVTDGSRRTWPQTEALKAHLALLEATNDPAYSAPACATFDILMDEYLTPEGGWIDHYAEDGAILAHDMPASTGYHVVLAFAELIRIAGT